VAAVDIFDIFRILNNRYVYQYVDHGHGHGDVTYVAVNGVLYDIDSLYPRNQETVAIGVDGPWHSPPVFYIHLICSVVFMTGFLLIPEYAFLITSLGLFSVYWYSICLHAYNESIIWELFYDRCGCYKTKIIDRGLFGRRKMRNISYG